MVDDERGPCGGDEPNRELMGVRDDAEDPRSQSLAPLGLDEENIWHRSRHQVLVSPVARGLQGASQIAHRAV
jgi:hypothetical protein